MCIISFNRRRMSCGPVRSEIFYRRTGWIYHMAETCDTQPQKYGFQVMCYPDQRVAQQIIASQKEAQPIRNRP
jgi:hypothetical protein